MTTYEARAGFAVADAIRACAAELKDADGVRIVHVTNSRLRDMGGLLHALADMLDQPPHLTREDAQQEAIRLLRGMCNHD